MTLLFQVKKNPPKPKSLKSGGPAKTRQLALFVTRYVDITTSVSCTDIMSDTQSVDPIARISPVLMEFTAHCTALELTAQYSTALQYTN